MKVLLVNKFHYKRGGSETYYFTLADALKKAGHEVIFFAMKDEKNITCDQEKYFVSNVGINAGVSGKIKMIINMNYSKEAYKNISKLIEDEKPDVAILNLVHKQITCSIIDALEKHNVKILWTVHDLIHVCPSYTMLDGNGNICEKCLHGDYSNCYKNKCVKHSKIMSYLSTREAKYIKKHDFYNKVDTYICPSEFHKNKLQLSEFSKAKIICLRNPLPLNTIYTINDNPSEYILYFGRLSKEKGVKNLIESMKKVNYSLKILGTGPMEEELKVYVKKQNLSNKIEFCGFQTGNSLKDYIFNSKCVILPSICYENAPYSATEAMAMGKPLIVSDLGGLPELVNENKNGYIFKNIDELSSCINRMINLDSQKYKDMCNESLKIAKEKFDANKYVKEIERICKDVE